MAEVKSKTVRLIPSGQALTPEKLFQTRIILLLIVAVNLVYAGTPEYPNDRFDSWIFRVTGDQWIQFDEDDRAVLAFNVRQGFLDRPNKAIERLDEYGEGLASGFREVEKALNDPEYCERDCKIGCDRCRSIQRDSLQNFCVAVGVETCTYEEYVSKIPSFLKQRANESRLKAEATRSSEICATSVDVMNRAARESGGSRFFKRALWKCGYFGKRYRPSR